jgi:hypothetical protein
MLYSGAKAIADAIAVNISLRTLVLSYNKIGDEGAKALAEGIKVRFLSDFLF